MINLALVAYSPQDNPDRMLLEATFEGNYGVAGGVGDTLNLTPEAPSSNPTGFTDPEGIYGQPLAAQPVVPPCSFNENLDGAYVQAQLGASLATNILRCFAAGGAELVQGNAYPANFLNGSVILEVLLPLRTAS